MVCETLSQWIFVTLKKNTHLIAGKYNPRVTTRWDDRRFLHQLPHGE